MKIQAITGMKDLLPEETPLWEKVEGILRETVESYGYSEIRMPILEKTDLFVRSIGEVTDVVEKEMYSLAFPLLVILKTFFMPQQSQRLRV